MLKCAEYVKQAGINKLATVEEISGVSERTLRNWYNSDDRGKRFAFDAVVEKALKTLQSENISV